VPFHPPGTKWSDGSVSADIPMTRLSELFNVNHFIVSQVNPHVAPFVYVNESKRGFFSALFYLLKSELKHRVLQVISSNKCKLMYKAAELGLIPSYISRFQPIVTQKYSGNITIVPRMTLSDFTKILSNPSNATMKEYMEKGQSCTWPSKILLFFTLLTLEISYVKHACTIEFTLEKILENLRNRMGTYDRYL
jgi:TAG lipase/steryl ester hydrolase/phospholipase A2/LPA acyltransferase